jgi:excisionase family DNA binding protein
LSTNKNPIEIPNDLISQAEAARLRGVSRQAIKKLVGAGRLTAYPLGGRDLVRKSEVLRFVPLKPGRRSAKKGAK